MSLSLCSHSWIKSNSGIGGYLYFLPKQYEPCFGTRITTASTTVMNNTAGMIPHRHWWLSRLWPCDSHRWHHRGIHACKVNPSAPRNHRHPWSPAQEARATSLTYSQPRCSSSHNAILIHDRRKHTAIYPLLLQSQIASQMNQLGRNNHAPNQKDIEDPLNKSTSWRKSYQNIIHKWKKTVSVWSYLLITAPVVNNVLMFVVTFAYSFSNNVHTSRKHEKMHYRLLNIWFIFTYFLWQEIAHWHNKWTYWTYTTADREKSLQSDDHAVGLCCSIVSSRCSDKLEPTN
jgi:hypothetical protein